MEHLYIPAEKCPVVLGTKLDIPNKKSTTPTEAPQDDASASRPTWDSPLEFLLSCVSMSVGLGNVWRFPGVAAAHGGGAFLIPYLIVVLLISRPLYYLEMCLGQFSRYGQVKVWHMAPLLQGVGYGSIVGTICLCSYYCSIMAITAHFFFASFSPTLPWGECPTVLDNITECDPSVNITAQLYYQLNVFPQLPNVDEGLGSLHIHLALCLLFSWVLIFLALAGGVQSSGKVAYFTAIFPYVVLLLMLARGVTLPGAWTGIKLFLEPNWAELTRPQVWYAAVEQCFFSLGIGFGPVIMFSSYNRFRQNVYRDALIISVLDPCTSLLAGVSVFAVIGHLMETRGISYEDLEDIVKGPGLPFILYPQALAGLEWAPQVFAALFFLMFFTLGLGTSASLTGGVITLICDQFPTWKRGLVTAFVCGAGCVVGLVYVTEGGQFMLDLVDHYGAGFVIYAMVIFQCGGVAWIYGLGRICRDFEFMLGRPVGFYWKACWGFIIPVGLCANLGYYLMTTPEFQYADEVPYPKMATMAGWMLTGFAVAMIPIWAIHAVAVRKADSWTEKFRMACQPTRRWGPQHPKLRQEWINFVEKKTEDCC